MSDMKEKLAEIEQQVSTIKDPGLKKIAFEKLLEKSLGSSPTKNRKPDSQKRRKGGVRGGARSTSSYYSESQIRPEIKTLNVTGTLQGFPSFKTCGSKIDGYLWILTFCKKHNIDGLNTHEIAYIMSRKLYKTTKYSTVFGIRRKVSDGLVILEPGTDYWKITPDGEDYLKQSGGDKK